MNPTPTYAELAAVADERAKRLERVAYRLRQGAISPESAAKELREVADLIFPEEGTK